ncbi:MAG TPA: metallophosphoesterase [Ignavibacteria bacterium]|nr:metallophosphoesterase [Ignavibacteria bacterium]
MKRNFEKYINLGRTFVENHYKTEASKTQQAAKAVATAQQPTSYKIKDFFENNILGWFKHYIKSRFGPKADYKSYDPSMNPSEGVYNFKGTAKIALVADWANDTDESDFIGGQIATHEPDYTIHLGDTYYVGASHEIKSNFINPGSSWYRGTLGSFALLGNHEMYARGVSYFRDLLPSMGAHGELGQGASYMSLSNDYWIIIGLDTGYNSVGKPILEYIPISRFKPDCKLENSFINWLKSKYDLKNDKRGIVLLSHHQYCSAFESQYLRPAEQLAEIIGKDRAILWYWGHEHRLAIYGKYQTNEGLTAYGRCLGHGGMPIELVNVSKIKHQKASESNLVLFDNRVCKEVEKVEIGHNGYIIMTINNSNLKTDYYDENELIISEEWEADLQNGKIIGNDFAIHNAELRNKPYLYADKKERAIQ